jgi:hypothetical protein
MQEPPDRFVATRDVLVKELRRAGEAAAASALKAERRPTRLLWAVRSSAAHPGESERYVKAAEAAAAAQARGKGVRERTADLREAISVLSATVAQRTNVERTDISGALLAIAADRDALHALRDGTLRAVPESTGFGGLALRSPASESADEHEQEIDLAARRRARARVTEAKKRIGRLDRAVERAQGTRDRARDALDQADEKLAAARADREEAARALADAEAAASD